MNICGHRIWVGLLISNASLLLLAIIWSFIAKCHTCVNGQISSKTPFLNQANKKKQNVHMPTRLELLKQQAITSFIKSFVLPTLTFSLLCFYSCIVLLSSPAHCAISLAQNLSLNNIRCVLIGSCHLTQRFHIKRKVKQIIIWIVHCVMYMLITLALQWPLIL